MRWMVLVLLVTMGQAKVCVRPINPFITDEQVRTVVNELNKKGVQTTTCGNEPGQTEVWFYPTMTSGYGETFFYVSVNHVPGGVVGTVDTYRPEYSGSNWTLSVHPNGGVRSTKRLTGYSLKSESGRLGKWLFARQH